MHALTIVAPLKGIVRSEHVYNPLRSTKKHYAACSGGPGAPLMRLLMETLR